MGIMQNIFKKKSTEIQPKEDGRINNGRDFTPEERERGRIETQRRRLEKKRLNLLEERIEFLKQKQKEQQLAETIDDLENDIYGEQTEELIENPDNFIEDLGKDILKKLILGQPKPQLSEFQNISVPNPGGEFVNFGLSESAIGAPNPNLTRLDERQIRQLAEGLPPNIKEMIRNTDPNTLSRLIEVIQNT